MVPNGDKEKLTSFNPWRAKNFEKMDKEQES